MMVPALLSLVALLFLSGTVPAQVDERFPIQIVVKNGLTSSPGKDYEAKSGFRWVLWGIMNELAETNSDFSFNYTDNKHYGPYLESINGLAGNEEQHTYWELKVKTATGITTPDVGIGCYIPNPDDKIIFNYTRW